MSRPLIVLSLALVACGSDAPAPPPAPSPEHVVAIAEDGALALDGEATSLDALATVEALRFADVRIAPERAADHGLVLQVVEALEEAGVADYRIDIAGRAAQADSP